jgi:pullulanase/glycogen debranching enzyme
MMERLMIDTTVIWTEAYKMDGFRSDLMGHHTRKNIANVKSTLLGIREDLCIYGEGWEFGSGLSKGLNVASQFGASGLGVGMFNDKIRDFITGGSRDDPDTLPVQGFINGLSYDWNGAFYDNRDRDTLLRFTDIIKVGLAGNLQDFTFVDRFGSNQTGVNLDGTGHARDPPETIQHVSAHDDHCLPVWDKTAKHRKAQPQKTEAASKTWPFLLFPRASR